MLHVLPWHPCRYDCKASAELGCKAWDFMKGLFPDFALRMRDVLSQPALYLNKWQFAVLESFRA